MRTLVCVLLGRDLGTAVTESEAAVGIDVGLSSFAVLSDGSEIENPRLYQKEQKRLRQASFVVGGGSRRTPCAAREREKRKGEVEAVTLL